MLVRFKKEGTRIGGGGKKSVADVNTRARSWVRVEFEERLLESRGRATRDALQEAIFESLERHPCRGTPTSMRGP